MHQLRRVHQALPVFCTYLEKNRRRENVGLQQGQMRGMRSLWSWLPVGRAAPGAGIRRGMGTGSVQFHRMGRGSDKEYENGEIGRNCGLRIEDLKNRKLNKI
jgi:hypothetical protein